MVVSSRSAPAADVEIGDIKHPETWRGSLVARKSPSRVAVRVEARPRLPNEIWANIRQRSTSTSETRTHRHTHAYMNTYYTHFINSVRETYRSFNGYLRKCRPSIVLPREVGGEPCLVGLAPLFSTHPERPRGVRRGRPRAGSRRRPGKGFLRFVGRGR